MTHQDQAGIMLRASRPEIEREFGIKIEHRGQTIIGDYREREKKYYSDQLRYNAAKWDLCERIIEAFIAKHFFDIEVRESVEAAQRGIDEAVREAQDDWYRGQATKTRKVKFEPSYSRFRALFTGLRREVQVIRDKRVRSEVENLILALTHLSHNEFPAEALGFDVETPEERAARLGEKSAERNARRLAKSAEENAREAQAFLTAALSHKGRRRIPVA